ncbi:MAG: SET domain-containing protein-lysine N-methyltransferase [Proteobacteria bacterium]|nr:SET domain-containing protein-lysine N-methyltransferase [Pseudomonadota bacterium]
MSKNNTLKLDRKKGLYLRKTGAKGRGVYCTHSIAAGEVLEVTPAIILNEAATRHVDKTVLVNYTFITGKISRSLRRSACLKRTGLSSSLVMGIASFCNHSENPNAEVEWEERNGTLYYILTATRRIPKNTEICTTYGATWFDDRN